VRKARTDSAGRLTTLRSGAMSIRHFLKGAALFNQILVPTDGSPSALLAVRVAGLLCAEGGSLKLLHVTPGLRDLVAMTVDSATAAFSGVLGDLRDQVDLADAEEAARILALSRAALPPLHVETFDRHGNPPDVILDELHASPVDSAVLGSRGRGAIARAFFGSVADAVVRKAQKPVLIARRLAIGSILVGVDDSESSRQAARAAAHIARQTGAALALLHVADLPAGRGGRAGVEEAVNSLLRPVMDAARAEILGVAPGISVVDRVVFDEPAHGLLEDAARFGADLIVLGRTGRTRHDRPTLGSVALRVVAHADASVLVVP